MINLVTSDEIRKFENNYIKVQCDGTSLELMEKAGKALAEEALNFQEPYFIICGKGNNGGDGLVAARHLIAANKKTLICLLSDRNNLSTDSKINLNKLQGNANITYCLDNDLEEFNRKLLDSNTIIECILGTGITGSLSSKLKSIIKAVNDSNKNIIACDIPLGINPDTGAVNSDYVKAKSTITFGYPKVGLFVYPGKEYCGDIKTIDIGLPTIKTNSYLLNNEYIKNLIPNRKIDSNKGTFGKTLVIAGSYNFPGAALLTSKAAASIGSGLTLLSSPDSVFEQITKDIPEVIHIGFNEEKIIEAAKSVSAIVIGPGLGNCKITENLVTIILEKCKVPIVLDADAINVLVKNKEKIINSKSEVILTPHPKELSRLLNINIEQILDNKIKIVKSAAKELKCTLLLKGAGSIICTPNEELFISPFCNSALAKGGTGDVLSGFIGGLIAQGSTNINATITGVYIHGLCGELIREVKTEHCLLPQDIIAYLPSALKVLRK